jgi:putative modified peptide
MADQLTGEQVNALLDKLSTDDDFRDLFTRDLGAALQQLPGKPGIPKDCQPGGCLRPVKLADKATIAKSRQKMYEGMTAMQPHIPKVLEAGG